MTCIIGLVDKGNVYIGGDSAGVSGLSVSIRADEKVFFNGPFLMGFTSSFRMGQLLRFKFDPPKQTASVDDYKYMVTDFMDAVRKCFCDNGFGKTDEGGTFLVGYKSKLYCVEADYQVGIQVKNYAAVGCGRDLALGSMYSTPTKKAEDRITLALTAASAFNAGVAPPYLIHKLPKGK